MKKKLLDLYQMLGSSTNDLNSRLGSTQIPGLMKSLALYFSLQLCGNISVGTAYCH